MRLTLLLVEDNPDDADILREVLAEPGSEPVRLVAVETLREGFAALDRMPVDLLLLDLSLPDSQGLGTLTRALAHPARIPIIVLTGLDDAGLGVEAIHAGAQDYLVKGRVDGALLHRSMHYAIERHRLLAERTADAQVSAALVRVGEALLAGLRTRALLDRLCHVAAEVLGCDATSTWVLDPAVDAFLPTAANTSEVREQLSALRVAAVDVAPLTRDGAAEVSVHVVNEALRRRLPESLMRMPAGVDAGVCLTLRRGGEVVGVLMCGYRADATSWTPVQERIASGLVHIAALALDNAQLVAELEESNTIKTYFAATMSHELRNTVFAIGGLSEMLMAALRRPDGAEPARLAQSIGARARESLQLIQAALEVTRSEVRPTRADEREVSLADLVEQVYREFDLLRDGRPLAFEWHVAPEIPAVRTDAVKLRMVLKNLVGNALKFTERGTVRVVAERVGAGVRLTVSDTGIGIPAEELPHLFEPFRQAHGQMSRRAGGAGLGLYIVRRLIDLLGATIVVESVAGQGTSFAVGLPLQPPEPSRLAAGDD